MRGRLRIDIPNDNTLIVFVNKLAGYLTVDDFAEKAVRI
jgi:hypothetical protein